MALTQLEQFARVSFLSKPWKEMFILISPACEPHQHRRIAHFKWHLLHYSRTETAKVMAMQGLLAFLSVKGRSSDNSAAYAKIETRASTAGWRWPGLSPLA